MRRRLSEHGALGLPVVHLTTAAAATERVAAGDVRCVLLDLSLPDAQGMQALHAMRAIDDSVPVVVLTGLDSDSLGLEALQAGAQDYLVKGQHAADAVARSVLFAMERAQRQEAERRQAQLGTRLQLREAQLSEAQRLARVGSWEWDMLTGEVLWSDELKRLTGVHDVAGPAAWDRYLALVGRARRAGGGTAVLRRGCGGSAGGGAAPAAPA